MQLFIAIIVFLFISICVFYIGFFVGCRYSSVRIAQDIQHLNTILNRQSWNPANADSTSSAGI